MPQTGIKGGSPDPLLLPQNISCHFYAEQLGLPPAFQTFYGMSVHPGRLAARGNTFSISAAGLLCDLRDYPGLDTNHPLIRDVIMGNTGSQITLHTTRVLDFGPSMGYREPCAVYRQLITMDEIEERILRGETFPSTDSLYADSSEILAASRSSNTAATEFFDLWEPAGVHPESCFIVIATIHDDPLTSFLDEISSSQGTGSLRTSPHPSLSADSSHSDVVVYNGDPESLLREFSLPQNPFASLPEQLGDPPTAVVESSGSAGIQRGSTRRRSASLCAVYDSLQRVAIADGHTELLSKAQFRMNTTPKQKLVQYRSMNCLLETLGLSNTNPKVPQELQASIYTKLSYDVVLRACNWSGQNDTDFDVYQIWLSAKYFWSVESLNIETEPNPASSNESEKAASSLRHEKSWEKIKSAKFRNTYTEAI
ncbi:hypothetical protein R3P38DRAFT_3276506 [Favolaschia claudopus]|uniref:Uncharacterized protein n=1 Tax=Favolaschia claudopus TaxID=2862362 RepID=A0AAW0ATA3_9AGAR